MEIDDIRDEDSLLVWLEDQDDYAASVTIAARAALRVQPWLWSRLAPVQSLAEPTALPYLHLLFGSCIAAKTDKDSNYSVVVGIGAKATSAMRAVAFNDSISPKRSLRSAVYAADGILGAALDNEHEKAAAKAVGYAAKVTKDRTRFMKEVRIDVRSLSGPCCLWSLPLWHDPPEEVLRDWQSTRSAWRREGPPWKSFADVYDCLWGGNETNWGFLERVALIASDIWEAGAEALAREIARIEEQMRLLTEVEALRGRVKDLTVVVPADATTRSDNLPEGMAPLDVPAEVARQVVQLRVALEEVQQVLAKTQPEQSELERAARSLLTVNNALLAVAAAGGAAVCAGFMGRVGEWLFDELILNGRLEALARQIQAFAAGL